MYWWVVISIDTELAFMTGCGENACMKVVTEMLHVETFETRIKILRDRNCT